MSLTFDTLRLANDARAILWEKGNTPTLSYCLMQLAGEVGEACNIGKKLERAQRGMVGGTTNVDSLIDELADAVICADLVASQLGYDLGEAVTAKFNATSKKHGFPTRLPLTENSS